MKTISFERAPKYDANIEHYGEFDNTCFCCGKPTAKKLYVHYTTHGELVNERDETKVNNSQGFFPVGPECAKKYPADFVFKF